MGQRKRCKITILLKDLKGVCENNYRIKNRNDKRPASASVKVSACRLLCYDDAENAGTRTDAASDRRPINDKIINLSA